MSGMPNLVVGFFWFPGLARRDPTFGYAVNIGKHLSNFFKLSKAEVF